MIWWRQHECKNSTYRGGCQSYLARRAVLGNSLMKNILFHTQTESA